MPPANFSWLPSKQNRSAVSACTLRGTPEFDALVEGQRSILDRPDRPQPTPRAPLPALLEYTKPSCGVRPAVPGGVKIGMEYVAAPWSSTDQLPAVRPAAIAAPPFPGGLCATLAEKP